MSTPPYVELHAHSAFSFLDGASTPLELAYAAEAHGCSALALTDRDGVWGSREFADACEGLPLRPLTGTELTGNLAPGRERPRVPQPLPPAHRRPRPHPLQHPAHGDAALGDPGAARGPRRGSRLPLRLRPRRRPCRLVGARRQRPRRAPRPAPARG